MTSRWSQSHKAAESHDRKLRLETLEQRCMLSADGLDLAVLTPGVHQQLRNEIMEQLQLRTGQYGLESSDLLRIPALRNPWDVNLDGIISPIDPLLVINRLNSRGSQEIAEGSADETRQFDVNLDGIISPLDPLQLVNAMNSGQLPSGHWWQDEGGVDELVVSVLEDVQGVLDEVNIDGIVNRVRDVRDSILSDVDSILQSIDTELNELGYEIDAILDSVFDTRERISDHLGHVHDLIAEHVDYVDGRFYDDLAPEGESRDLRERVDALLDRVLGDVDETVAWHLDYVDDLIDQHINLVREGVDLSEIDDLIGTHVDYVVGLLDIHDVHVPDLSFVGGILDHVHHVQDFVDDLGDDGQAGAEAEHVRVPTAVRDHFEAVSDHVGYVWDLIDAHRGVFDRDQDWRELLSSHLNFVRDLLGLHGLWDR